MCKFTVSKISGNRTLLNSFKCTGIHGSKIVILKNTNTEILIYFKVLFIWLCL